MPEQTPQPAETTVSAAPANLERPVYVDRMPPCNLACPAGENIQEWLRLAQAQRYQDAWREIMRHNPLPAIHGRVCYHPCENACNRKHFDEPLNIHGLERFLGDLALREKWSIPTAPSTGKRILIIGSGPCGLSAAYHLALLGHKVTVHESSPQSGGMMRYAIPEYRLPRAILDGEIDRIARMGVDFVNNTRTDNLDSFLKDHKFDAVLLAIGAQLSKRVDIPSDDATRILDALQVLADPRQAASLCVGRRVAIYGGGNTAMDAARAAIRMGAQESIIIYRRNQERMPAHQAELDEALLEGVKVHWLRTITHADAGNLEVEVMELDAKGSPKPTGRYETIPSDVIILALGQETHSAFLKHIPGVTILPDGTVKVDTHMMTGCPGLFAGGDMVPANKTVTTAVGHGKKAARNIDAWLRGQTLNPAPKNPSARHSLIHGDFYPSAPRAHQHELPVQQRVNSFAETTDDLQPPVSAAEIKRCLSCGNCFECDTCIEVCPDQAITRVGIKDGPGTRPYQINMDYCSRCRLCVESCPCGAMNMVPDPKGT